MIFRVSGDSMEPFLRDGQLVFASNFSTTKVNDVIVFRDSATSSTFVKRVVAEYDGKYVVKGDNQDRKISVLQSNILGKVWLKF
jgi:phage repressor protein C with HTH and peptisase S24 domain